MTVHGAPDLATMRAWLGLDDPTDTADDAALQASLDAALAQQSRVVLYPCDEFGDQTMTPDLVEAVLIRSVRLVARRNSPEGVVGLGGAGGDFVAARIPAFDSDVQALENPYRRIPVA